jgi:hypothetical protein
MQEEEEEEAEGEGGMLLTNQVGYARLNRKSSKRAKVKCVG